jgi:hypothetical protein
MMPTEHVDGSAMRETSWIDWRPLGDDDAPFLLFVAARHRATAGASRPSPPDVFDRGARAAASAQAHRVDAPRWRRDALRRLANAELCSFGCTFDAAEASAGPRRYALLVNGAPDVAVFTVPPEHGGLWRGSLDTASEDGSTDGVVPAGASWKLTPRSLI